MSKEKNEENSSKEFNILDTPLSDDFKIEFIDDFRENNSVTDKVVDSKIEDEEEVIETTESEKEEKKETTKSKKKEEVKEEETKVEEEIKEVSETEESTLKTFANWLGEKGLVDYKEEEFEDSEDGLRKLMSSTIEQEVKKYKNSLPEDVHKLVEFIELGGNPKDFMDIYYNQKSWSDFEITDEASQKKVLKEYLKAQGEEDEDITETLETYEVSGILEKKAKTALTKLQTYEKSYQEQVFESQKKYDAEQKELIKKQYEDFREALYKKEEIQGFKLTPKMKDNLWDFIMKPDKSGKTGLQKHNETNEDAQFLYAYLAMNDWNLEKLERQVKTKVNSELASKLSNFKDSRAKMKSGQSDNFASERKTGFSAFKQALDSDLI